MTNAAITIQNETTGNLSLDTKINEDVVIRELLKPKGTIGGGDSVEIGDKASLDELNKDEQIQALLSANPAKISISVVGGTTDVAGSDAATAVSTPDGLGGSERLVVAIAVGGGGAEDVTLLAAMPFAARIVDCQLLVDTAEATTWTLRDALAGAGNALSDDLSTAAVGRVRDAGSDLAGALPTIAKGDPLVLRKAASATATGHVLVELQRLS